MHTPLNTPSGKQTGQIKLNNIDFNKFFENQNNFDYEENIENNFQNKNKYCDIVYLGNTKQIENNSSNKKVKFFFK